MTRIVSKTGFKICSEFCGSHATTSVEIDVVSGPTANPTIHREKYFVRLIHVSNILKWIEELRNITTG